MQRREPAVHVDEETYPDAPADLLERAVRRVLDAQGGPDIEISVALLGDADMRRLNDEYLGRDRTTDVLAFALPDDDGSTVGDIYLGYEQAQRQAEEVGVPFREELARLAIHGTLHVLGHDHPEGPERVDSEMFRLQERLLTDLMENEEVR